MDFCRRLCHRREMAIARGDAFRSAMLVALLVLPRSVRAQHADLPLKSFHLSTWLGDNGPPLPATSALMRSPDGYLWIGARRGLVRFDGVRFAIIDSSVAPALNSQRPGYFTPSLVDRDGWLWVQRPDGGLVQYRDGVFRVVQEPNANVGPATAVDGNGELWLGGVATPLRLWRNGRVERPLLPAGVPDTGLTAVIADTGKGIWIGTVTQGLWHVVGSHAERALTPDPRVASLRPLLQGADGALWLRDQRGLYRFVGGQSLQPVLSPAGDVVASRVIVQDSSGAVWIGTSGYGVLRWWRGTLEQFSRADGLSDDAVEDLLIGDAGSIWLLTHDDGLHQLRPTPFTTLNRSAGGSLRGSYRFVEDDRGKLWGTTLAKKSAVLELSGGLIDRTTGLLRSTTAALPTDESYEVLGGAHGGGVWLGPLGGGLTRYRPGHVSRWTVQEGLPTQRFGIAREMRDGTFWVANVPGPGFGRVRNGRFSPVTLPGVAETRVPALGEDDRGHLWASVSHEPFIYEIDGDRIVRRLGPENGMHGAVAGLTCERGDTLWGIVGDSGLVRIAGGRAAFLRTPMLRRLLSARSGLAASDNHLWLIGAGVARLSLASLHAAADGNAVEIALRFFSPSDGIATPLNSGSSPVPIFRAHDGRVWMSTPNGLAVVDPSRQFFDSTPPRLHIEEVSLAGRVIPMLDGLRIPTRPATMSIRYTAISLLSPERTRIQYRLEGADEAWVDAVGPRVATYAKLRPGAYTFRLRAWNVDGVQSARDEILRFRVPAAWYETTWSRTGGVLLIALAGALGALAIQRRRTRRAAELMRSQFAATLTERTRIARELHDTLLQEFTGVTMLLAALRERMRGSPNGPAEELTGILSLAKRSLFEARQSVWDMRSASLEPTSFVKKIEALRAVATGSETQIYCRVNGNPRTLDPGIERFVMHVAREAVSNAVRHAHAGSITVELTFETESLTLTVRDDGVGMTDDRPQEATRAGHFGLVGMRERVESEGGSIVVTSAPGEGTTIELTVSC